MENQKMPEYETIRAAVAGEKWAVEKVVECYIFMLPLCYRVGKLLSDFMGFLIIDFPRLKGLYQMKG